MSCYMSKKNNPIIQKKKYYYLYAKKRITKHKYSLVVEQVSKYPNSDTWIVLGIWREMGWRPVEGFFFIFYHIIVTKYGYDCDILSKFHTWPFIIIIKYAIRHNGYLYQLAYLEFSRAIISVNNYGLCVCVLWIELWVTINRKPR